MRYALLELTLCVCVSESCSAWLERVMKGKSDTSRVPHASGVHGPGSNPSMDRTGSLAWLSVDRERGDDEGGWGSAPALIKPLHLSVYGLRSLRQAFKVTSRLLCVHEVFLSVMYCPSSTPAQAPGGSSHFRAPGRWGSRVHPWGGEEVRLLLGMGSLASPGASIFPD